LRRTLDAKRGKHKPPAAGPGVHLPMGGDARGKKLAGVKPNGA
jgi:hypothetical protein